LAVLGLPPAPMGILAKAKTPLVKFASTSNISKMLKASRGDPKVAPSLAAISSPPTTSLPNCTPPAPHSTGQLFHPGPVPRKHLLYFDMVIPNAETVGLDHVGSYRCSLIHSLDEVIKVDSSISLFPMVFPSPTKLWSLNLAPLWEIRSPNWRSILMVSGSPETPSPPFCFCPLGL